MWRRGRVGVKYSEHSPNRWNWLIWRSQKYPVQVVDIDGTGTNWSCSKCGEEVLKEKVDQVGGQQSLIAKILINFITNNSIKCSHHGTNGQRWASAHHDDKYITSIMFALIFITKKVEEMIGSLVGRLEPSTDCIVWRFLTWRWLWWRVADFWSFGDPLLGDDPSTGGLFKRVTDVFCIQGRQWARFVVFWPNTIICS